MPLALAVLAMLKPAWATCPAGPEQFGAQLHAAYAAYSDFDVPTFSLEASEISAEVPCLTFVVQPEMAARLHLVEALRAWLAKDPSTMLASFRGLVAADPTLGLSADIAPPGSRVRSIFDEARAAGGGALTTPRVGDGVRVTIDGRTGAATIPTERAALVQVEAVGVPLRSWYLSGGAVPDQLAVALQGPAGTVTEPAPPPSGPQPDVSRKSRHASRTLLVTGLATGLASGASLFLASNTGTRFFEAGDQADADALYEQNQVFGYGGYGLGVIAVGLGASAVIVGQW